MAARASGHHDPDPAETAAKSAGTDDVGRSDDAVGDAPGGQVGHADRGAHRPEGEVGGKLGRPPEPPGHCRLDNGAEDAGGRDPGGSVETRQRLHDAHDVRRIGRG